MRRFRAMLKDARGATAVEYGLICALIVVAMLAGLTTLGRGTTRMYSNISTKTAAVL